jgi:uncharacterized heparinase superfamily protein
MLRTVRHMRPSQVAHRLRLRAKRAVYGRVDGEAVALRYRRNGEPAAWPIDFRPIDAIDPPEQTTVDQIRRREFTLVGQTHELGGGLDWSPSPRSQLWRYHLHYFEWAWPLCDDTDGIAIFAERWREWSEATAVGRWDAWSPYVVSLRAWALCGLRRTLIHDSEFADDVDESLRVHAGYLRANLELDVGGNHLVKNLKALIGLGIHFDDVELLRVANRHLERELKVQVGSDGGHFERSPSYHVQVLGDLIDVLGLLTAASRPVPRGLQLTVDRMRAWLGTMLLPDGDVPLLKDCLPVSADRLRALGVGASTTTNTCTKLADSGYIVVRVGPFHAVLDVGQPCPPTLPAHAHADSLNWVLAVHGRRCIVDTGVSTYQDLDRRSFERSTAAHNTVEIDGCDSTEVYGAFRAGRRAHVRLLSTTEGNGTVEIVAEHDGYAHLDGRPLHRRIWRFRTDRIEVTDRISGSGKHLITGRIHLAPGAKQAIDITSEPAVHEPNETEVATGMASLIPSDCLVLRMHTDLPASMQTTITVHGQ